jgi:hypothetical protein
MKSFCPTFFKKLAAGGNKIKKGPGLSIDDQV